MTELRYPLADFRAHPDDIAAVTATLESGWITMGPETARLEAAYAERLGVAHAIATSSGTTALHLAYLAAGIGPGDEVIVPAITFVATAAAVHHCGATPVAADVIGLNDVNIDPDDVLRRITPRTKAVCAMHYAGFPARTTELADICEQRGLALIEDSAHHPSLAPTGSITCISFFTNKVLACGQGGLLATDDPALAERVRLNRAAGLTTDTWARHSATRNDYDVEAFGYNYRIDDIRSALLNSRLARLDEEIAVRRDLIRRYRAALGSVAGMTVPFADAEVERSGGYVMPILLDAAVDRDELRTRLRTVHGIQTSILYPALHELSAWPDDQRDPRPHAEAVAARQLTLPLYGHMGELAVDEICAALTDELARVV